MMAGVPEKKERNEALLVDVKAGLTITELCEKYGMNRSTILGVVRRKLSKDFYIKEGRFHFGAKPKDLSYEL